MKISELDYELPKELIAQSPSSPRDHSRLMVVEKKTGKILHKHFYNLPEFLTSNDVLVFNKTKVFPARVFGTKDTGGKIEILLLKNLDQYKWETITKPGIKVRQKILFQNFSANYIKRQGNISVLEFDLQYLDLLKALGKSGK